jgi:hypothetical protein
MEATCSSETSVETRRTTLRHIPEDGTLRQNNCLPLFYYIPTKQNRYKWPHKLVGRTPREFHPSKEKLGILYIYIGSVHKFVRFLS